VIEDMSNNFQLVFRVDGSVVRINESGLSLFGFNDTPQDMLAFFSVNPEFQPDGVLTVQLIKTAISHTLANGSFSWQINLCRADGKTMQLQMDLHKIDDMQVGCCFKEVFVQNPLYGLDDEVMLEFLEHAPNTIFIVDGNANILYCNFHAMTSFGIKSKDAFATLFFTRFSDKFQRNILAQDYMRIHIEKALEQGLSRFSWDVKRDFHESSASIRLVRIEYMGKPCCVAYLTEFATDGDLFFADTHEMGILDDTALSILDSMPFPWVLLDAETNCIDCNMSAIELLSAKNKQELIARFSETFFAGSQPCGKDTEDLAAELVEVTMRDGLVKSPWTHTNFNGDIMPLEITLARVGLKNRFVISVFVNDLRAEAELASQKSLEEERLNAIFENSPHAINIWGKDNKLLFCNDKMVKLVDADNNEEYLRNILNYYPETQPDGRNSVEASDEYLNSVLETGNYLSVEWTMLNKNGEEIPICCEMFRIRYGGDYAVLDFVTDMRPEYAREELIKRESHRFRAIFDAAPFICELWNKDRQLVMANAAIENFFGFDDPKIYINRFEELSPVLQPCGSVSIDKFMQYVEIAFERGFIEFEWMHQSLEGEQIPCQISFTRVELEGEYALVGATTDLREQRQMEKFFKSEAQRFGRVFNAIPATCTLWNKDLQVIMANQYGADFYGFDHTEELVDDFHLLYPEYQPDGRHSATAVKELIERAFAGEMLEFPWMHQMLDGTPIPTMITLTLTEIEENPVVLGFAVDMRAQVEREELIKRDGERFEYMFANIPASCTIWDEEGNIITYNAYAVRFFGFENIDELFANIDKVTPPVQPCGLPSDVKAKSLIKKAIVEGFAEFEWMHQSLNGEPIPCIVTLTRIEIEGVAHVMGFATDMRPYLLEQELLKKEATRFKRFFDNLPVACAVWDVDEVQFLTANQAIADLFKLDSPNDYFDAYPTLSPKNQPCGESSLEKGADYIKKAVETGYIEFEWVHQNVFGDEIPCIVTMTKTEFEGKSALICLIIDRTAQLEKDEILRNEIERFELFFSLSPAVNTFWDHNRNLTMCNAAAADMFGFSSTQEYLDRFEELSPSTQPCGTPSMEKAMEYNNKAFTDGFIRFDWMHQLVDGTPVPTEIMLTRVEFEGKPALIGFTVDKRAEIERTKEIERFDAIFNHIPMAVHVWAKDGRMVYANNAMQNLYGYTDLEDYKRNIQNFYQKVQPCGRDSVELSNETIAKAFETGYVQILWEFRNNEDYRIPLECTLIRIDYAGEDCVLEICRDLRMEMAEQKIREEAEQRLHLFMDNTPIAGLIINKKMDVVDCNTAATFMFGYTSKNDFITNFKETIPEFQPDGTNTIEGFSAKAKEVLTINEMTFDWMLVDRAREDLPVKITLIKSELGDEVHFLVFMQDMTVHYDFLKEQEMMQERLRSMVDASPNCCFVTNREGIILDCNKAGFEMFGVSDIAELNQKIRYLHAEEQDGNVQTKNILRAKIEKIFNKEEIAFDWNFKNAAGEVIPAQISTHSMYVGHMEIAVVYAKDMREHYRYQEEVRRGQEMFMAMVNMSPIACIVTDENQYILSCNQMALSFFDVDDKDEIGFNYIDFCQEGDCDRFVKHNCWVDVNGESIPVELNGRSVIIAEQNCFVIYITDLREAMRLEEERRRNRQRMAAMLDSSPLASILVNREYRILSCNESLANLFGLEIGSVKFITNPYDYAPKLQPDGSESKVKMRTALDIVFDNKQGEQFEWMWQTSDGEMIPSQITLKSVELEGQDAVIAYIHDLRHIKQIAQAAEDMEKLLNTDALTGAYNRRYMYEVVPYTFERSIANGESMTVMMIDVDYFKKINDTYGHQVGDEVLKILVARITHSLRKDNVVCRYGGEEFIVVMPKTSVEDALKTACRVKNSITRSPFFINGLDEGDLQIPITVSLGLAGIDKSTPNDTDLGMRNLIHNSDMALYKAKKMGRNRIYYSENDENKLHEC